MHRLHAVVTVLTALALAACPAAPRREVSEAPPSARTAKPKPEARFTSTTATEAGVYGLCAEGFEVRRAAEETICWPPDDERTSCTPPCCLAPSADDRRCTRDDDCVRIYADCGRSCSCIGVRADRSDAWELKLATCTDCRASVCNYECLWEDARCIDGACRSVRVEMPLADGESPQQSMRREAARAFDLGRAAVEDERFGRARVLFERALMLGDARAAAELASVRFALGEQASTAAGRALHRDAARRHDGGR